MGLNSGTSADGVDAVACEMTGRGLGMRVHVLGHVQRRYPPSLKRRILAAMAPAQTRTEEICELDADIGQHFARVAGAAVRKLGIGLQRLDLIGSHGQTLCHLPPGCELRQRRARGRRRTAAVTPGTMQLCDPAIIATHLRTPVVAHFRQADMAVGGQGAPLVPWTDYVLFRHRRRSRVIQNIGGIANLTYLRAGGEPDDVVAFDTGPGNMVIDGLVRHFTDGRAQFDRGGRRAARGAPHPEVLKHLFDHRFIKKTPPKSCGREDFGEAWLHRLLVSHARRRLSPEDWIATATTFTAGSIAQALARFLPARRRERPVIDEIIVCGGGARNGSLLRGLAAQVSFELDVDSDKVRIMTTDDCGVSPQAKEALSFAMLAAACVDGVAASLPKVTGARRRVVLGQVCAPEPRG